MSDRQSFSRTQEILPLPDLLSFQQQSFRWALETGIKEALEEFSPMTDNRTLSLHLVGHRVDAAVQPIEVCREQDGTYAGRFFITARLQNLETGEMLAEQEIYVCELPLMTPAGTFIVNGNEKTVVSQLTRSPGAYFSIDRESTVQHTLGRALVIPHRGAWLEVETKASGALRVRADKKAPLPVTTFFRALGFSVDTLKAVFDAVDPSGKYWEATTARDTITNQSQALLEFHRKIRAGEVPTLDSAKTLVETMFFNARRYSLGRVGRYMLNRRLGLTAPSEQTLLTEDDLLVIVRRVLEVSLGRVQPDDMDHLGNRRVRGVGELLQQQLRLGLAKTERNVRSKMNTLDLENPTPADVLNVRSLAGAIKELFVSAGMAQSLDQTNMLDEITHKRKLSALGPGGLNRERAGMKERDVHPSHYGRLCPIETPEGQNVGLITSLALHARINDYGFIETPYRKVVQEDGRARATNDITYLTADAEERYTIAQANTRLDERGFIIDAEIEARRQAEPVIVPSNAVELMDVSTMQIVSAAAALIPFLEHDDGSRALMGANMQRQAVPLLNAEAPYIGTGLEAHIARNSGHVLYARRAGVVESASDARIIVRAEDGECDTYPLVRIERSNAGTLLTHRVRVRVGDQIAAGQLLADTTASAGGDLALGRNLVVAFLPWEGYNFEDAIVVSERLVREDVLNSIHIETFECKAVSTKLGPEEITRDLPNIDQRALVDLDDRGIVRVGARVTPGSILVGKITPKSEGDPSPEERLLRAIFGEKAKEVRDTSLRLPHGEKGEVIDVQIYTPKNHPNLPAGTKTMVRVTVAVERKVSVGDKLAGRHGNKGVVSRILPVEDMPTLPDGTPVDVILNPLGVPSRMNVGQILETHMGWAAKKLDRHIATPIFDGATEEDIFAMFREAGLPESGKIRLRDGRSGEWLDAPVTVGVMYMLKLHHLVDDKIHARSTGPYTLVTQQPLGGKAQFGGQRLGEMEVWALEGYGAAHNLLELLTIKSDDHAGRIMSYWAILNNKPIEGSGITESLKVLMKELQSLGLDLQALDHEGKPVEFSVRSAPTAEAAKTFRDLGASHRFES